jgi:hypothetical protein
MELIHILCERDIFKLENQETNHSLENLASKTKLTGLLKSTRCAVGRRAIRRVRPEGWARIIVLGFASVAAGRESWWSQPGSNRRPSGCKPDALPAELWPRS